MGDWSLLRNNNAFEDDTILSAYGAVFTTSNTNNVKGTFQEIVASLPYTCSGVLLEYRVPNNAYFLVDIAVGGAGVEQVVIPNICPGGAVNATGGQTVYFPITIKAGSRISIRAQASGSSTNSFNLKMQFITDTYIGVLPVTRWIDWGTDLANSRGSAIVAGNPGNTKGSWTQLVAVSDFTTKWLAIQMQSVNAPATAQLIDIGVGGAGVEQVVIPDLYFTDDQLGTLVVLPFSIPGGSRIAARSTSSSPSHNMELFLLGGA